MNDKLVKLEGQKFNTEFLYRFFGMLEKIGIDQETIDRTIDFALSDDMLERYKLRPMGSSDKKSLFQKHQQKAGLIDEFFSKLTSQAQEMGVEEYKKFIEGILSKIPEDFEKSEQNFHISRVKTNFANLFIRNLILQNPQDIKIEYEKGFGFGQKRMQLTFGGVEIGFITFEEHEGCYYLLDGDNYASLPPSIDFSEFRIMPGLERLGVGTYLFREFCKEVTSKYPNYSVMANTVHFEGDGRGVYYNWGAKAFIDGKFLEESEFDENVVTVGYYFTPEIIEDFAKKDLPRYDQKKETNLELN